MLVLALLSVPWPVAAFPVHRHHAARRLFDLSDLFRHGPRPFTVASSGPILLAAENATASATSSTPGAARVIVTQTITETGHLFAAPSLPEEGGSEGSPYPGQTGRQQAFGPATPTMEVNSPVLLDFSNSVSVPIVPPAASLSVSTDSIVPDPSLDNALADPTTAATSTSEGLAPGSSQETPGAMLSSIPESEAVVAAYYADWSARQLAPEDVDFTRFNWIDFAFAIPNENFELAFTQDDSEDLLHRLVVTAHSKGRKAKLSIGGWTGSAHFSRALRTSEGRTTLCRSIERVYAQFGLDGIDIDWEYPNAAGAGNEYSPDDAENLLTFLELLRKTLPPSAKISAATALWPFAGKDGQPLRDVSRFARVLDWIMLMNYDVWGSSPEPGPNAPLSDECGTSTQPLANAKAAIQSWIEAGFPPAQIVLGIPAYGMLSRSSADKLRTRDEAGDRLSAKRINDSPSTQIATTDHARTLESSTGELEVHADEGGSDGQIQFGELVRQGALVRNNGGDYEAAGGFERKWDHCSSTPWLRSEARGQVIAYDDPESVRLKADLGRRSGLLGVSLFAAHGDDGWALVDGARRGLGI
ncbi:glycoside hydrolase [Serendipita vermifera]|nr:glycoside hydrolase [Serendipita vermifera]